MNFRLHAHMRIFGMIGLLILTISVFSCIPPNKKEINNEATQDFSNPLSLKIYNLQQEQNLDSLLYFMESEDPMARFCATRAFGSFITPKAVPAIRKMLKDTVQAIKEEAVYVAGQLGDTTLADDVVALFEAKLTNNVNLQLNKNVLEAIGKIGSPVHLSFLSTSSPYPKEYELLNQGKAHAFYQFALRGITNENATKEAIKMATEDYSDETRIMAANYLLRTRDIDLSESKFQLLQALFKEENPDVRMGLSAAVAKTGSSEIAKPFLDHLNKEEDYRVVVNGLRNLGNFNYIEIVDPVLGFLSSDSKQVASAAAGYLKRHGKASDARFYLDYLPKVKDPFAKLKLQGAVLSLLDQYYPRTRGKLVKQLEDQFKEEKDISKKVAIISALGSNPYTYETLDRIGLQDSAAVIQSKATEMLAGVLQGYLPSKPRATQRYLAPIIFKYLSKAILSGDAGSISGAASALANYDKQYLQRIMPDTLFTNAFNKLEFPENLEPMQYLADAHNLYFPDKKLKLPESDSRRSLINENFSNFNSIYTAIVETSAGEIQIELYMNHAPESVLNFIDLAEQDFYDGKVFHRVVDNFVVQAGCPRGDGYGSESYTIRSELSPMRYLDEGYVGMASAGKHTESTQWFITHSPTPHLSGRYTIFGKVKKGMNVVHDMDVGTKITNVSIVDVPQLENTIN